MDKNKLLCKTPKKIIAHAAIFRNSCQVRSLVRKLDTNLMGPARNQGDGHQGEVLFLFVGKKCELRFFRSRSSLMANGYPVGFPDFAEVVREELVTRRGSFYNCQVAFLNLTLPDQRTHPCGCFKIGRASCRERG